MIETLVVLLIMGLLIGLVSAIARPDPRGVLQVEAERLAQLLELAATESRLSGRFIGWTADETGYRFWRVREDGWSEIHDNELLRPRALPHDMTIASLRVESIRPQGVMRLEFSPYVQTLAFTIELSSSAGRYAISASPMGEVRATPGEGTANGTTALR